MSSPATERSFQDDIIQQMAAKGWLLGDPQKYNRERALYEEDLLGFVQDTQHQQWEKFTKLYPKHPEQSFLDKVTTQLDKADPHADNKLLRKFGTLGVLRHEIRDRGTRFSLCQFKPDHGLNPETLARYEKNRCRVVPELVYSPWAKGDDGGKKWRIDLVLFVNGIPIATMELKSEFKQAVHNAMHQYRTTRLPIDPATKKREPLLTFKRGALVHFAVSQYEVYMTTHLKGEKTFFLPFNKGTMEGGQGNDVPEDPTRYATDYLWNEVLEPDALLNILARFIHLQIVEKEDYDGKKYKQESLIFPRYHQWDVVRKLLAAAQLEGPGNKYLIQHSAGSGKSNSIAWTAHQLASLYDENGEKRFHSVIVVTDRTVLDDQLQDTITQFEHTDGVIARIHRNEGSGSKSEKLAAALAAAQPIIIVTIQTFPFVVQAIEHNVNLRTRAFAIIADEAHSSQSGSTARKLKEVLMIEGTDEPDEELSSDDLLDAIVASRTANTNVSFFAFTATPKAKTLELFGRPPRPGEALSDTNIPKAFHVYSMRQAIEEGFILDVLKNYTPYQVAYQLALTLPEADQEVESRRAKKQLNQWVRLHAYNIAQKVKIVVEHFREHVMPLLNGQAKAMVVTSSRKEVVRYKHQLDAYLKEQKIEDIQALVAFSGEVIFSDQDPDGALLAGETFTESNMNPGLKGRDMRRAFDTDEFQLMLAANKFQTGFDQPKLCAMYVDKKLGGVECVQTLSRLNRTYPGKEAGATFILDFVNKPEDILKAFQPYYETAELQDVSDPNLIYDLFEKLKFIGIFLWREVEQFCEAFMQKRQSPSAIANICKPAMERWKNRYDEAIRGYQNADEDLKRAKRFGHEVEIANATRVYKENKQSKDDLELFKKDLASFVRFYEFMSQIVDYNDRELEKMALFARHLAPLLREHRFDVDALDLDHVALAEYRMIKLRQQELQLKKNVEGEGLLPIDSLGTGRPIDPKEEFLSSIIERLNSLFDKKEVDGEVLMGTPDKLNYFNTICDRVRQKSEVMMQIKNNTPDQALLGDFPKAMDEAIMDSAIINKELTHQLLSDPTKLKAFMKVVLDVLLKAG